jgi:hypothetical protein
MNDASAAETPAARYVKSAKNIAGCVLAVVGGFVLIFTGVVAAAVGLLLMPVLYAIGALAAPARRRVYLVNGLDQNDVRRSLDGTRQRIMARVPARIDAKVITISRTIKEILPRADALGPGSPGKYVLYMCATDYLPTALQAYLDLPRQYADAHVVADGKTSLDLLVDQLDLLEKEVNEIAVNVNRADTDKLLANGRFLEEKFGSHPLDPGNGQRG